MACNQAVDITTGEILGDSESQQLAPKLNRTRKGNRGPLMRLPLSQ